MNNEFVTKNIVRPPAPKKLPRSQPTFSLNVLPTCYGVNLTTESMAFNNLENAVKFVQENTPFFIEMVVIENGMVVESFVDPNNVPYAKNIQGNAETGSSVALDGDNAVFL
jgi:hypothetical protein